MDPETIQMLLNAADSLSVGRPEIADANTRRPALVNYRRVRVRRDGNGFFRAASYSFWHTEAYYMFLRDASVARMRAFQSEYNEGYTPQEFEDYLLKCAKFGESADSNLQLACAETFKVKVNVMKAVVTAEGTTLEVLKEILPRSGKSHFEIYMFHPPAYAIHPDPDLAMYRIMGDPTEELMDMMSRYTEYQDDSGDERAYYV